MFKNLFKIAIRSLLRHKVFSFINIFGLAIGMSACILIVLFIADELSFDQHHANKERIYRLEGSYDRGGQIMEPTASTNFGVAPLLKSAFPEIEDYVRLNIVRDLVKFENKKYIEEYICYTDSSFFKFFSFQFLKGNPSTFLNEPNTAVITEKIAQKYFGKTDPLGRFLNVAGDLVKITGIIKEAPRTSHFHANIIIPVRTVTPKYPPYVFTPSSCGTSHYVYVRLPKNYNYLTLQSQFKTFISKYIGRDHNKYMQLFLQPLTKIHLYSRSVDQLEAGGDITYIYIFGLIALIIIVIACVNYVNLTTARAIDRAKEIGLRKVTGATKWQLVRQFLGESILISLAAFILAYLITLLCLPMFDELSGKELSLHSPTNFRILIYLAGISLLVGLLAGIYPAIFMSSFNVTYVLKGSVLKASASALSLRKGLVVLQFCISSVLIISTLLIFSQLQFMRKKKLGINPEQIITVGLTENTSEHFSTLKTRLLQNKEILAITSANNDLTSGGTNWRQYQWKGHTDNDISIPTMDVDIDFFNTLDLHVVSGRKFSKDHISDVSDAYMINETAAKFLDIENPINEPFLGSVYNGKDWTNKKGKIIGVVKDFHFASMHQEIKPVVFNLQSKQTDQPFYMWIRISNKNIPTAISFLQDTWKEFEPEYPMFYSFLDEDIQNLYKAEDDFLKIFITFSGLAVIIACLGIFGLVFYTATQRVKEIGIRKTLGASISSIVLLLSKDFTKLVMVSFIVSIPIAWYLMSEWLQNFAYRIDIGAEEFIFAGFLIFVIAWLTVSYHSIKAAIANPVKSLRTE